VNTRIKTRITWTFLILCSATLAFLAIFSLYREYTLRQDRQTEILQDHSDNLSQQLLTYFEEIKLQSARQLIAFHEEGLAPRLKRWKESNPLVHEAVSLPANQQFPSNLDTALVESIDLDAPDTPSVLRSGYYLDNKEIALYENGATSPILFWTFQPEDTVFSWSLAHRLAPERPIRTATLSNEQLTQVFNRFIEQTKSPSFNSAVVPEREAKNNNWQLLSELPQLPGYVLTISTTGENQTPWYSLYGVLLILLCVILGTLCIVLISRQTKKERQEALQKSNFVSQISHEFKTPLTSISLYADLLAEESNTKFDRSKLLETISRESHRLSDLVDNILALNALEKGKKQYRIQTIDAVETVSSSVEDYMASFAQHGLQLEWARPHSPIKARFDPASLRQILLNLLDNARKYAASGKKVSISIQQKDTICSIAVSDFGPGIPKDDAKSIFESFYQKSSTLTQKSPGVGIGLSLSRKLARDCGGDLTLDKTYNSGARFLIHLPLPSKK